MTTATAIAAKPTTKKPVRILFVTARYYFKAGVMEGTVCYAVRSQKTVKGQLVTNNYQVMIHTDGVVACNCESRKALCVHNLFVSEIENERDANVAELDAKVEAEVAEVLAELNAQPAPVAAEPYPGQGDDCPGSAHALCCRNTLQRPQDEQKTACPVVSAPTIASKVAPAAIVITQLKTTPTVAKVSQDWLLGPRHAAFSGRAS